MFNHANDSNLTYRQKKSNIGGNSHVMFQHQQQRAFTTSPDIEHLAERDIEAGEQIFFYYGEDWFSVRGIEQKDPPTQLPLQNCGAVCVAGEVEVLVSALPGAGRGLFTKRAIRRGELVAFSPALVVPRQDVDNQPLSSLLLNYAIDLSSIGGGFLAIPIGALAAANHASTGTANVRLVFWDLQKYSVLEGEELNTLLAPGNLGKEGVVLDVALEVMHPYSPCENS
jgi:hypothetical protein